MPVRPARSSHAAMSSDPYYKKTVEATVSGRRLQFRVAQDLFSSHQVDEGTALLLRHVPGTGRTYDAALALGCG
jgi:16S rRNA G1207 methylase RsmC